jgi:hypothetical protein
VHKGVRGDFWRADRGFGGEMGKESRTNVTHHRSNHLHFDDEVEIRLRLLGRSSPSSFLMEV